MGFSEQEPEITNALEYFIKNQQKNGLWKFEKVLNRDKDVAQLWLTLVLARIFKRFYS